jgi:two-component system response regulator RegA
VQLTTVLVVEDDPIYRRALGDTLTDAGFSVILAECVADAVERARSGAPDLALVDLRLPDGSGIDVVRQLPECAVSCRAVMLSGHATIPAAVEAMRAGAVDFLTKPVPGQEIVAALLDALEPLPSESLEQMERTHILAVLNACGGNISEAARRLGLYRRTLQRKLQKLPAGR